MMHGNVKVICSGCSGAMASAGEGAVIREAGPCAYLGERVRRILYASANAGVDWSIFYYRLKPATFVQAGEGSIKKRAIRGRIRLPLVDVMMLLDMAQES